jgi:hypothetical protein
VLCPVTRTSHTPGPARRESRQRPSAQAAAAHAGAARTANGTQAQAPPRPVPAAPAVAVAVPFERRGASGRTRDTPNASLHVLQRKAVNAVV